MRDPHRSRDWRILPPSRILLSGTVCNVFDLSDDRDEFAQFPEYWEGPRSKIATAADKGTNRRGCRNWDIMSDIDNDFGLLPELSRALNARGWAGHHIALTVGNLDKLQAACKNAAQRTIC